MRLDRRAFSAGLFALGLQPSAGAAAEPVGLFWRATAPNKAPCTLFGYARIAAAVTADIVADGTRDLADAQRLVLDMPNFRYATAPVPTDALPPISGRVAPVTAARLRSVIAQNVPASPLRDRMSGLQTVLLLRGEGQAKPQPSVGGTIAEHATGKPVATLVTAAEMKAAFHPPDVKALDARVDEPMLSYLLGLRDVVGPLGAFEQSLYARRRTADLASADADMARHHVPGARDLIPVGAIEPVLIARAVQTVETAPDRAFLILPVGLLTQENGILSAMRKRGIVVDLLS